MGSWALTATLRGGGCGMELGSAAEDNLRSMADDAIVIAPSSGWQPLQLRALWSFRDLAYFFVWRELKLRYKQTLLGTSWALVQPLLLTAIFAVVFGRLVRVPSEGIPYPLFAFLGLIAWTFFAQGVTQGTRSLVANSSLISRVYFPRILLPLASISSFLLDLLATLLFAFGLMALYGRGPGLELVALPALLLLLLVTTTGVTLLLAAAGVQYRDVQFVIPFLIQVWLFATPIVYPATLVPDSWQLVYALNPMTAVVDGFRWALVGASAPGALEVAISTTVALALLVLGSAYFRRMERTFADVI
jgi:lipopolysaccharide transport system permease protein